MGQGFKTELVAPGYLLLGGVEESFEILDRVCEFKFGLL